VTTAELARATARIEHSLDALVVRVGDLASVVGALRGDLGRQQAVLDLREEHQAKRTSDRDRQIADVHARLDAQEKATGARLAAQEKALGDLQRRWWTMTGRMTGVVAAMTILGSGAATAVARLTG
jgi:hypothetical protein